jgi:formylglycine-generating enzyme required for sulfatase activity
MSQTPVTQAQWKAIASLPQEGKELKLAPSRFTGDDLPVERVTWQDAIEFCARLSRLTRRNYRLPSEAEWEYACRAIPNQVAKKSNQIPVYPPFHFWETLTSNLANYRAIEIYRQEVKGEYREKTTPVRSFPPNAFGLYDVHGNIREWCLDPWHENYEGAREDGKVWDENDNDTRYLDILSNIKVLIEDGRTHILRGGSWNSAPQDCRSASRYHLGRGLSEPVGFRPVFSVQDSSPLHS